MFWLDQGILWHLVVLLVMPAVKQDLHCSLRLSCQRTTSAFCCLQAVVPDCGGGVIYRGAAAANANNPEGACLVELGCFTSIFSQRHSSQQQQQHLPAAAEAAGYNLVSVVLVLADGVPVPGEAYQDETAHCRFRVQQG